MTKYIRATYTLEVPDDLEAYAMEALRALPSELNEHVKFTDTYVGVDYDAQFRKLRDRFIAMMQTRHGNVEHLFYNAADSEAHMLASYALIGDATHKIYRDGQLSVTWGIPASWNCAGTEALLKSGVRVPF